jgi:hypothetical protein
VSQLEAHRPKASSFRSFSLDFENELICSIIYNTALFIISVQVEILTVGRPLLKPWLIFEEF